VRLSEIRRYIYMAFKGLNVLWRNNGAGSVIKGTHGAGDDRAHKYLKGHIHLGRETL